MRPLARVCAFVVAAAIAAPALAQHGVVAGALGLPTASTAAVSGLSVTFIDRDALGLPTAGTVIAVSVVERSKQGDEQKVVSRRSVLAHAGTAFALPSVVPGRSLTLHFAEASAAVEIALPASGRVTVVRYKRELTDDDIAMDVRANLSVRDGAVSTWVEYSLSTAAQGARHWTAEAPFDLPLLAPAVRDTVIDRGVITPSTKDVEVGAPDGVQVLRGPAGLQLIGSVAPGRPIVLRVRYPIAISGERVDLGLRGAVGKTAVAVATVGVRPVRIRMDASRPARIAEHEEGRERYTGLSLVSPLPRGESVIVRLLDFPAHSRWPGRLLRGMTGLFALFALAFALRHRNGR